MTYWECPQCGRIEETKDNIVMVICYNCQVAFEKKPFYMFKNEVEVDGEN